jgi:hypothetical protein
MEFMLLLESAVGLPSQGKGHGRNLKVAYFMEIIVEGLPGNIVISKVDALMYVILSTAEKHVPCGELDGTTECVILQIMRPTNRSHYN